MEIRIRAAGFVGDVFVVAFVIGVILSHFLKEKQYIFNFVEHETKCRMLTNRLIICLNFDFS